MPLFGLLPAVWRLFNHTIITPAGVVINWPLVLATSFYGQATAFLTFTIRKQITYAMESNSAFTSHLPQPTRVQPLADITGMELNTRESSMQPPARPTGRKHALSNLPESAPKRKTLAERGGEPYYTTGRTTSYISSMASRSVSNASARSAPSASFTTSLGSGIKAPANTQSLARPKTALAKSRNNRTADARPATAMADMEGSETSFMSTRRHPLSFSPCVAPIQRTSQRTSTESAASPTRGAPHPRGPVTPAVLEKRDSSLSTAFQGLGLGPTPSTRKPVAERSPSRLPRPVTPAPLIPSFSRVELASRRKTPNSCKRFLTRFSDTEMWDPEAFSSNIERIYQEMCTKMDQTAEETKESVALYRSQIQKLEQDRTLSMQKEIDLQTTLNDTKHRLSSAQYKVAQMSENHLDELKQSKKTYEVEMAHTRQQHAIELRDFKRTYETEMAQTRQVLANELKDVKMACEIELKTKADEVHAAIEDRISTKTTLEAEISRMRQEHAAELSMKLSNADVGKVQLEECHRAEMQKLLQELQEGRAKLVLQTTLNGTLSQSMSTLAANAHAMEHAQKSMQAKIDYLESDSKSQSEAYAEMEKRMRDAIDKADQLEEELRQQETMRRKLHNQVLELKGNIRVFCRVRPHLGGDPDGQARITFPEADEPTDIEVKGHEEKNSLGTVTTKKHPFSFDRVFNPTSSNTEIFDEISQLIQSALDGYNVCIFAYGQTGSGKTHTMSSEDGMIPRALRQIYSTSERLKERGWTYTMEGSFVEVYNEDINDLLSETDDGHKKKHEVKHDMQKAETTITDVTTVDLNTPEMVDSILERAMTKRSVAATKMNEHSSRSHSVFILKLVGENSITGEKSKGTLNLVDLAGSERLSQSKAEGIRLKETQSINKSLSSLGDVIGALGQKGDGGHVPYRNSKLTYLLQFSLGGNSKTLMFVMVSPLKEHLGETLCSLKFAAKVHSTHIGVAKKALK